MMNVQNTENELKEVQSIETLDLGGAGMVCDFNTGVCGPVNEGKEENK